MSYLIQIWENTEKNYDSQRNSEAYYLIEAVMGEPYSTEKK